MLLTAFFRGDPGHRQRPGPRASPISFSRSLSLDIRSGYRCWPCAAYDRSLRRRVAQSYPRRHPLRNSAGPLAHGHATGDHRLRSDQKIWRSTKVLHVGFERSDNSCRHWSIRVRDDRCRSGRGHQEALEGIEERMSQLGVHHFECMVNGKIGDMPFGLD